MSQPGKVNWKEIRARAGGYPPQAYDFVREGLAHTAKLVHGGEIGEGSGPGEDSGRHVTGQQLCLGLKDYAIEKYGRLARTVLGRWGVRRTEDFGKIVFAMIEAGLMRKTEEDSLEDFQGVFDFDEVFAVGDTL